MLRLALGHARTPQLHALGLTGRQHKVKKADLLTERKLFEYWTHAACFLPIEDFGQFRRFMLDRRADTTLFPFCIAQSSANPLWEGTPSLQPVFLTQSSRAVVPRKERTWYG